MLSRTKNIVKRFPRVYDGAIRIKHLIMPADPLFALIRAFSHLHDHQVRFIQIGAADGLRNDPVRPFIVNDPWTGILVEPLPTVFASLEQNYKHIRQRLTFVNAAIGATNDAAMLFWTFSDEYLAQQPYEDRLDLLRKSSFERSHLARFNTNAIVAIEVPCITLAMLVAQHWPKAPLDLLVIDAEGHEPDILQGVGTEGVQPEAILFESHNLHERREPLFAHLRRNDYLITTVGGDSVAVRTKSVAPLEKAVKTVGPYEFR